MALHFSRRKTKPAEEGESTELNVVPYLDILMNLILFMLLSMTGLATWGVLKVTAPPLAPPGEGRGEARDFTLTVAIAETGFIVGTGDELEPVIPRRADGRWDVEALRTRLEVLKAAHPSERRVFVAAGHDTAYQTLVETLDATRETIDRRPLFPEVTLAGL